MPHKSKEGGTALPNPPESGDNILIFVDDRTGQDCPTCPEFPYIELNALEQNILTLYGPNATGQVSPEQIASLGYTTLKQLATAPGDEANAEAEALLAQADWVIFAMLNIDPATAPQSDAMRLLLRNRYDALRNKKLIVFAFNAPYHLDETEISQLTAYYGLYSKTPYYLASAARLLFQQFEPSGASPVGISAVGPLDLNPNPAQMINIIPVSKIDTTGTLTPIDPPPPAGDGFEGG